jgi:hypothetical protein
MSVAPASYVKKTKIDFTRKKKLPFETVIQLQNCMGATVYKKLLESQVYDVNIATTSPFDQQRNKFLPSVVEFLFHGFTQSYTDIKDYQRYRLLAVDGSDLQENLFYPISFRVVRFFLPSGAYEAVITAVRFFLDCTKKKQTGIGLFPIPFRIPFLFPLLSLS